MKIGNLLATLGALLFVAPAAFSATNNTTASVLEYTGTNDGSLSTSLTTGNQTLYNLTNTGADVQYGTSSGGGLVGINWPRYNQTDTSLVAPTLSTPCTNFVLASFNFLAAQDPNTISSSYDPELSVVVQTGDGFYHITNDTTIKHTTFSNGAGTYNSGKVKGFYPLITKANTVIKAAIIFAGGSNTPVNTVSIDPSTLQLIGGNTVTPSQFNVGPNSHFNFEFN